MNINNETVSSTTVEKLICPIRYTLEIVGGKWKLPIICMLANREPLRYSKIKRKLSGITNMMLSQSLKELEAFGMVYRKQYNEIPPRVEYTLTEIGKSIVPTLETLAEWGETHMKSSNKVCSDFCDKCHSVS